MAEDTVNISALAEMKMMDNCSCSNIKVDFISPARQTGIGLYVMFRSSPRSSSSVRVWAYLVLVSWGSWAMSPPSSS